MRALLIGALALLASTGADARRHDPEKLPLTHVRDLHYGDVLFYFFQNTEETDLRALTRLLAYEHWGRLSRSEDEALLLEAQRGHTGGILRFWESPIFAVVLGASR